MKFIVTLMALATMVALSSDAFARGRGGGGRVHYGGGHHTTSHGGHYSGGSGSSHRGGSYRNFTTSNRYGTHK